MERALFPAGVDAVLRDLGASLGLPGLCLDANGCCQLSFQGRWMVTLVLHPDHDRLVLHCPISTPGEIEPAILLAMLQGNFMGCAAGGGSLAISPDHRACVQQELPLARASATSLGQAITRLLSAADAWASRFQRVPSGPAARPLRGLDRLARHA